MLKILLRFAALYLLPALAISATNLCVAADSTWKKFSLSEYGFAVDLPSEPEFATFPSVGDDWLVTYRALDPVRRHQYSVFVGQLDRGIFEPASMDAFLDGHVKAMVGTASNGVLKSSRRITHMGFPALEYSFSHQVNNVPFMAKGVTFMIDGGYIRLSMWYPEDDKNALRDFDRFNKSFKLLPIGYRESPLSFSDPRGVTFTAPVRWVKESPKNAFQAARYSNLTRSIVLLVAGNAGYTCRNFRAEVQSTGRLVEESQIKLGGQQFTKIVSYEDVPKYNLRLTNGQYCLDSRIGAIVLVGTEEKGMYWRWSSVFEGTAASVRVK